MAMAMAVVVVVVVVVVVKGSGGHHGGAGESKTTTVPLEGPRLAADASGGCVQDAMLLTTATSLKLRAIQAQQGGRLTFSRRSTANHSTIDPLAVRVSRVWLTGRAAAAHGTPLVCLLLQAATVRWCRTACKCEALHGELHDRQSINVNVDGVPAQ